MSKIGKLKELYRNRKEVSRQLKWMTGKTRPYFWRLILILTVNLSLSVISLSCTLLNKRLIDNALSKGFDTKGYVLLVVLTLVSIGIGCADAFLSTLVNERFSSGIRKGIFSSILKSKWQSISSYHSEDLLTRLTSDVGTVSSTVATLIPDIFYLVTRTVMAFVVLYRFDRLLALTALVLGPLGVLAGLLFSSRLKVYETRLRENESAYRGFLQECIANITVVKSFGCEDASVEKYADAVEERISLIKRRNIISMLIRFVTSLIFRSGYLIAFGWGIHLIASGSITYGTMSVFLALVSQIQGPIMSLAKMMVSLVSALASAGRLMETEEMEKESDASVCPLKGGIGISLRDVSFAYEDENVLEHVGMEIRPGETAALIGDSGQGKTTMARLLLALLFPSSGRAGFTDEYGAFTEASKATRPLVSYVPQGNTLLSGTIRENLLIGRAEAGDGEIENALRAADAWEFVRKLPNGVDTRIGEKGIGISEGQAQRVAIARALLKNSPVLILDEATSSLDVDTEKRIIENLKISCRGVTCLVITHRPSLLKLCTRCFKITSTELKEISLENDA